VPSGSAWAWNQALMDLGATICTVQRPACIVCPLVALCEAAPRMSAWPDQRRQKLRESRATYDVQQRRQSDNQRFLRGRIVDLLRVPLADGWTALSDLQPRLAELGGDDPAQLERTVRKLATDGLLVLDASADGRLRVRLPD
jgi:A/G-specific adenine glycosylase